jgi:hypothetical protein
VFHHFFFAKPARSEPLALLDLRTQFARMHCIHDDQCNVSPGSRPLSWRAPGDVLGNSLIIRAVEDGRQALGALERHTRREGKSQPAATGCFLFEQQVNRTMCAV